jgi:superfamily II DNA or RNA helicase
MKMTPSKLADWNLVRSKLRDCQKEAVVAISYHLKQTPTPQSFLACLATGAGKSGIIATIAQATSLKRVLIISPRRAVCDQLKADVAGKFFQETLGLNPEKLKAVETLGSDWTGPGIYVATFQKLTSLDETDLANLCATVDLLILDEGHSEPAPVWRKAARQFKCHKIIFTATPYRNDLFQFDIHNTRHFVYTFKEASRAKVIREPKFIQINHQEAVDRTRREMAAQNQTRCIVKCKSLSDVHRYFNLFKSSGFKTIAIHEKLKRNASEGRYASVPKNIRSLDAEVIVYQRMLDEGIDIPEAKLLLLTYPLGSGRETVQTVGRIVRPFKDICPIVLDLSNKSNETMWVNYLAFDDYISDAAAWKIFAASLNTAKLLNTYLDVFPDRSYFGSSFKKRFDFNDIEPKTDLTIPLASGCFIKKASGFSMPAFCDSIYWRFHSGGELVRHFKDQDGFDAILAVRFENSRYLKNHLFFQPALEILLVREVGDTLVLFDSRSANYNNDPELCTLQAIGIDCLLKLAARSKTVRTKEAHSAAVGTTAQRAERISLMGFDLEKTPASAANSGYALSTLKVDNIDATGHRESGYYIGTNSGRVADQKNRNFSLQQLNEWVNDIAGVLAGSAALRSALLSSFAQPTTEVPTGAPRSVLFDLSGQHEPILLTDGNQTFEVPRDFIFLEHNGTSLEGYGISVSANFDSNSRRLEFSCDPALRFKDSGEDFCRWLNKMPVKALYDGAVSYYSGNFYRITLPTERGCDIEDSKLGGHLIAVDELAIAGLCEKGKFVQGKGYVNTTPDAFDPSSLFALIDRIPQPASNTQSAGFVALRNLIAGCDVVFCTDMGTEPADFILASPSKVCFLHVKCGDTQMPRSPAGALAEVGGQAMKNIEHIVSKNELLAPGNASMLRQPWPSGQAAFQVENRVRYFRGKSGSEYMAANGRTVDELFDEAWSLIAKRRASDAYEKEVWILAGNSFSRSSFISEIAKGKSAASESLQAYQLIDSWQSHSSDHDVALRIFVGP